MCKVTQMSEDIEKNKVSNEKAKTLVFNILLIACMAAVFICSFFISMRSLGKNANTIDFVVACFSGTDRTFYCAVAVIANMAICLTMLIASCVEFALTLKPVKKYFKIAFFTNVYANTVAMTHCCSRGQFLSNGLSAGGVAGLCLSFAFYLGLEIVEISMNYKENRTVCRAMIDRMILNIFIVLALILSALPTVYEEGNLELSVGMTTGWAELAILTYLIQALLFISAIMPNKIYEILGMISSLCAFIMCILILTISGFEVIGGIISSMTFTFCALVCFIVFFVKKMVGKKRSSLKESEE